MKLKKLVAVVTNSQPADAVGDLSVDFLSAHAAAGAERAIIAERAAACRHRAVHVGTREAGIHAHFLYPLAKPLTQEIVVGVVSQSGRTPGGKNRGLS